MKKVNFVSLYSLDSGSKEKHSKRRAEIRKVVLESIIEARRSKLVIDAKRTSSS